jgi:hypothetical protein
VKGRKGFGVILFSRGLQKDSMHKRLKKYECFVPEDVLFINGHHGSLLVKPAVRELGGGSWMLYVQGNPPESQYSYLVCIFI